jgi:predicted RecB family nuclease
MSTKTLREKTVFSATDICNFADCKYLTLVSLDNTAPDRSSDQQIALIIKKGLQHEEAYLDALRREGATISQVCSKDKRHPYHQFHETLNLLKQGAPYIAQAMLTHGRFSGIADLLRRVEVPSQLGSFSYEVIDTKLAKEQKTSYLLQLTFYGALLESIQGRFPKYGYIIDGSNRETRYDLAKCNLYFQRLKDEFLRTLDDGSLDSVEPEPCAKCPTCDWKEHCEARWHDSRHLSLVARINASQRKRLRNQGINSIDALASAPPQPPDSIHGRIYERLRQQAILQCSDKQPAYVFIHPDKGGIGFCDLPDPSSGDLFYDIEADPLIKAQALEDLSLTLRDGLEYLHGICYRGDGGGDGSRDGDAPQFKYFLATTKTEERVCYEQLIDFFWETTRSHPHAHIYHYSSYEIAALRRLNAQYPSRQEYLTQMFREDRFVDLYAIVRNAIQVSEPRYSIKNLEVFFAKEKRSQNVQGGGDSIVAFEQWLETGDQRILDDIIEYNRKDCISTIELFDWLHQLKEESSRSLGVDWHAEALKRTAKIDTEQIAKRTERREEIRQRIERFFKHFRIDEILDRNDSTITPAESLRKKIFYLADFYRQEDRPAWFTFFELQNDPDRRPLSSETLTNCTLVEIQPPSGNRRNPLAVYQAHVPSISETRMSAEDQIYDLVHKKKLGTLEVIDRDSKTLLIRLTNGVQPDDLTDLTVSPNKINSALETAIERFIEGLMQVPLEALERPDAGLPYAPLIDVLFKAPPRFRSAAFSEVVVPVPAAHKDFRSHLLNAAINLDRSYLFIQGPPGTGKTYHGSRLVLDLLAQGHKVGVTSNSHKAINNFLQALDSAAHREGAHFNGVKKADKKYEYQWYSPPADLKDSRITTRFSGTEISLDDYNVIAGTPWFMIDQRFDQQLDYLLVDEASQLSIAHLVAAGLSAKNLILIGDPQQLPQPLQGQHQAELEKSPLQLLLGDAAVVPPNRGVFLETSRRMHTTICKVLSEHVYDQKLLAPEDNQHHAIINPSPGLVTRQAGILFVPCVHHGNTVRAMEEVKVISELVAELKRCSFQRAPGDIKPLELKDIMIVSPYNLQVNLLTEHIPGCEIGTIDKFQGREAPVTIVSMTASDISEAPRGLDFLFNINRLNVALSRAKALAIIVASPELLRTRCKRIDQIELLNFFCALATPVS